MGDKMVVISSHLYNAIPLYWWNEPFILKCALNKVTLNWGQFVLHCAVLGILGWITNISFAEYTCEMKALDGYYQMESVLAGPSVMTDDACQSSCFGNVACNAASFSKSGGTCTTYTLFEERFENADSTYYAKTCPGEAGAASKS